MDEIEAGQHFAHVEDDSLHVTVEAVDPTGIRYVIEGVSTILAIDEVSFRSIFTPREHGGDARAGMLADALPYEPAPTTDA